MPTPLRGAQDGPRITVAELVKAPTAIPARIIRMMDQEFLVDALLRPASNAPGGAVVYMESTPLFADQDPAILDEYGEIPTGNGSLGTAKVVRTVRRALGLRISKTMIDRDNIDAVNIQLQQIKNTMVRAWEDAMFAAISTSTTVHVATTGTAWSASSGTHIRRDVNGCKFLIADSASDAAGKQKFGYEADTLVLSTQIAQDFLDSDEVSSPYVGNIADENLKYTGKLPNKFLGLDVVVSWRLSAYIADSVVVLQRKVFGGISDERPLSATPLYPEGGGGNGGPTESWRCDVTRASAVFIDQPLAVVVLKGVQTGSEVYPEGLTINQ